MNRQDYTPALAEFLQAERLPLLGPGAPDHALYPRLEALTPEAAFAAHAVVDRDMARACLAGLWLYFDFLDESHQISQDIDTPTGSYWHGVMHRREPDAANAAYWFRRVGRHPVFEPLAGEAHALGLLERGASWDPFAFIDRCEEQRGRGGAQELLLRRVQQKEWELLFDWCFRQALGR